MPVRLLTRDKKVAEKHLNQPARVCFTRIPWHRWRSSATTVPGTLGVSLVVQTSPQT